MQQKNNTGHIFDLIPNYISAISSCTLLYELFFRGKGYKITYEIFNYRICISDIS